MPDSYGKRKRRDVKARKAAKIEERRVARTQRRADRAAGLLEKGPPVEAAEVGTLGDTSVGEGGVAEDRSASHDDPHGAQQPVTADDA